MDIIFIDIALVIIISAFLAWLSAVLRQPLIIAYILTGVLLGPGVFGLIKEVEFIDGISRIGISLLLFLAGLVLHPKRLASLFQKTLLIILCSSLLFATVFMLFCLLWNFNLNESIFIGLSLMFSSTILVIKLMPTTTLHQKKMGFLSIAVLIAQDLIAIVILMFTSSKKILPFTGYLTNILLPFIGAAFIVIAMLFEQFILRWMMKKIDRFHELLYLLALGWCFGLAVAADKIGLSYEMGAFIAGITIARNPAALFFSEGLKIFRDFFLVLFFFTLGAQLDLSAMGLILIPAIIICLLIIIVKSGVFTLLFRIMGESFPFSLQIGVRLSQGSEFSLILAVALSANAHISQTAALLIQTAAIFSIIISSYITVFFFPTPLGVKEALKQD